MNGKIILWTFSACLALVSQTLTFAQKQKKWNIGISAGYGRDFFYRKFHGPKNEIPPGAITHFHSLNSWKSAVFAERFLRPKLSIQSKVECSVLEMPNEVMFNIASMAWYPKNESHHWGSFAFGARKYFKSVTPFKVFTDMGLQGDYFLGLRRYPNGNLRKSYWEAEMYYHFVPSAYASVGVRWKRFMLAVDNQTNVARSKTPQAKHYQTRHFPESDFSAYQGW
jgi:hypothetical protein